MIPFACTLSDAQKKLAVPLHREFMGRDIGCDETSTGRRTRACEQVDMFRFCTLPWCAKVVIAPLYAIATLTHRRTDDSFPYSLKILESLGENSARGNLQPLMSAVLIDIIKKSRIGLSTEIFF
jgi:hypothetical protein